MPRVAWRSFGVAASSSDQMQGARKGFARQARNRFGRMAPHYWPLIFGGYFSPNGRSTPTRLVSTNGQL